MKKFVCLALVTDAFGGEGGIAQYNRDFLDVLAGYPSVAGVIVLPRAVSGPPGPLPHGLAQRPAPGGAFAYVLTALRVALVTPTKMVFCGHIHIAPLAAMIAWLKGADLIVQVHGIEAWGAISPWRRWALAQAKLIFCVSRYTRAMLLKELPLQPERLVVTSNTVGQAFAPGARDRARARWDLRGQAVLLSVGRLDSRERYKGQDRVIAALPALLRAGLDPLFLIAGEGDDRPRLEALARDSGVTAHVRFLGKVDSEALPDLYRAADLFVLPSTGEGFGIVFLEAMACGTPALGLAAAGAVDALGDGELGAAVPETGLAAAMQRLLPAERSAVLSAEVIRRFGPEAFRSRIAGLLGRLDEPGNCLPPAT